MESVTVTRRFDAGPDAVRAAMDDVEPFMRAAGFDEVTVDDATIDVANQVGPVRIELALAVVESTDEAFVYEQREGIFETMTTRYEVAADADGTRVRAETEFALDTALVGSFLDATVISMQRRRELNAQLDYLAERVGQE